MYHDNDFKVNLVLNYILPIDSMNTAMYIDIVMNFDKILYVPFNITRNESSTTIQAV